MSYVLAYVVLIVAVNLGFSVVPMLPLPGGELFAPVSLAVGFVFIARDFAQRAIGHHVLWAMLAGAGISYILADPFVAVASAVAFAISELVDWAVYTSTRRPLSDRVLLSSIIGTPIDSAVFLAMIGAFGWAGFLAMTISKMIGAFAVWAALRRRQA